MAGRRVLVVVALLVAGAALPLLGQQAQGNPTRTKEPRRPGPTAGKALAPRGAPAAQPGAPAAPPAAQPAAVVTPQAVQTAPTPPPAAAFTAGLAVPPFAGSGDSARYEYLHTVARNLDSATVALVALFRNTSGQPMAGASDPNALSARERERWTRCRNLYWDYGSYATGLQGLGGEFPDAGLARAVAALDSALSAVEALSECDNLSSMISAPDRWVPWQQEYANAARHFYVDWYGQVLGAHDRDRALVQALNALLPAGRALAMPPRMPRNPPYAGAGVR
jgi:hypothetical protein